MRVTEYEIIVSGYRRTDAPLTLVELLDKHRGLFYRQDWYRDERFLRVLPNEQTVRRIADTVPLRSVPKDTGRFPLAVDVANAYVRDPLHRCWDEYIMCRDRDALGQKVFVAGCANGKGFEIHRIIDHSKRLQRLVWA